MVLLKNNGVLPLGRNEKIGVIGEFATVPRFQGGGSSHMNPQRLDTAYDELLKYTDVAYAKGYELEVTNETLVGEA